MKRSKVSVIDNLPVEEGPLPGEEPGPQIDAFAERRISDTKDIM